MFTVILIEDACGGIVNATISNGTLISPSYPGLYPPSKECFWDIVAPTNHAIYLNFTHFDLESNRFKYADCIYDQVKVYSKFHGKKVKKMGAFCGNKLPKPIMSDYNVLRLEFYSDKGIQRTGFEAHYQIGKICL